PLMAESPERSGGESLDVLQDEEGEDGNEHDHPRAGEPFEKRRRRLLRVPDDLSHVSLHEPIDLTDLLPLPPFAGEEAHDELAALDLLGHLRELLGESVDLGRQAWPDR